MRNHKQLLRWKAIEESAGKTASDGKCLPSVIILSMDYLGHVVCKYPLEALHELHTGQSSWELVSFLSWNAFCCSLTTQEIQQYTEQCLYSALRHSTSSVDSEQT